MTYTNEYPMCEVPRSARMSGDPASARMTGSVISVSIASGLRGHFDVDDDLRIGDVGDGVEGGGAERVEAERSEHRDRGPARSIESG